MKRASTHHYSMTRPELESMIRAHLGLDSGAEFKSIQLDPAHLKAPQTVLSFTVADEAEEIL